LHRFVPVFSKKNCWEGHPRIGTYPPMIMATGCTCSLESSRRRLMPVMSYHNPHQAPRSAVMSAAVTLQCRQMSYHTATPAKHCTQPSCQRLSPCSSAIMSAAVTLQGVTAEAPGEMRRDVGSDLVFTLFLGCVETN